MSTTPPKVPSKPLTSPQLAHTLSDSASTIRPIPNSPLASSVYLPSDDHDLPTSQPAMSTTPPGPGLSPSLGRIGRPRGRSTPTVHGSPDASPSSLQRVTSHPAPPLPSLSSTFFQRSASPSLRGRSRSPGRRSDIVSFGIGDEEDRPGLHASQGSTWWNNLDRVPRPWKESPRKQKSVPTEQTEAWVKTQAHVARAALSVLGTTGIVAHEVLLHAVDVLQFVPIAGLEQAAKALLNIWDAVQQVDMNRLACLRITERCANILYSVREEIADAGDEVANELQTPISKLVDSFTQVQTFLIRQNHRPFLKRYLKRDEILRTIAACDASLTDCLTMFSLSIQIRALKQIQAADARQHAATLKILSEMAESKREQQQSSRSLSNSLLLEGPPQYSFPPPSGPPPVTRSATPPPPLLLRTPPITQDELEQNNSEKILTEIRNLRAAQNEVDHALDAEDLRQLQRSALLTSNDAAILKILQVNHDEMPEAIKTLQRALERQLESDRDKQDQEQEPGKKVPAPATATATSSSVESTPKGKQEVVRERGMTKSGENSTQRSNTTASDSSGASFETSRDTLDREFLENGIDAMRRLSSGRELSVPPWTITRYEVDREEMIGVGFFSTVYRGIWRGHAVAIKVLAPTTPRDKFRREIDIWKDLRHQNVLELLGASSATGDPPWFFVSPYYKNGSLVTYLKSGGSSDPNGMELLRFMHEVAVGMEYLHSQNVLHGDLKGANVLISDDVHCVIADFGQSEMKSEASRISGTPPPQGTTRWRAPELLSGRSGLSRQADVYAFAICCFEVLTKGSLPWPYMDDTAVRFSILHENMRPSLPVTRFSNYGLASLIERCWDASPSARPQFSKIAQELGQLRKRLGDVGASLPSPPPPRVRELWGDEHKPRKSPDMHPIPLPSVPPPETPLAGTAGSPQSQLTSTDTDGDSFRTAENGLPDDPRTPRRQPTIVLINSSRTSTLSTTDSELGSHSESDYVHLAGYESPIPQDEMAVEARNERRYRLLLRHQFHPSLTLPLWEPTPVALGDVGYLSKPSGTFVTLCNCIKPPEHMSSVEAYGKLSVASQRQDKRNAAMRGLDVISGLIPFRSRGDSTFARRYSYPLRAGQKNAYLCTETTVYRYMEKLDAPKSWFTANIDTILQTYGPQHRIQREDVFVVIGTLDTPDYGLFISHRNPDGQVHFNVLSSPKAGQPWGDFSTDGELPALQGGPSYHEELSGSAQSASKVSKYNNGKAPVTVLVSRLRFKPDAREPTSL